MGEGAAEDEDVVLDEATTVEEELGTMLEVEVGEAEDEVIVGEMLEEADEVLLLEGLGLA